MDRSTSGKLIIWFMVLLVLCLAYKAHAGDVLTSNQAEIWVTAEDAGTGVAYFSVAKSHLTSQAIDHSTWTAWTPYNQDTTNVATIDVSDHPDGPFECFFAKFKDRTGHVSDNAAFCLPKDTQPPTNGCLGVINSVQVEE